MGQDMPIAIRNDQAANDAIANTWDEYDWSCWHYVKFAVASVSRANEVDPFLKDLRPDLPPGPYYNTEDCSDFDEFIDPAEAMEDFAWIRDEDDRPKKIFLYTYQPGRKCYIVPKFSAIPNLFKDVVRVTRRPTVTRDGNPIFSYDADFDNPGGNDSDDEEPVPTNRNHTTVDTFRNDDGHVRPFPFMGLFNQCNIQATIPVKFAEDYIEEIGQNIVDEDSTGPPIFTTFLQNYNESSHYRMGHYSSDPAQLGLFSAYFASIHPTNPATVANKHKSIADKLKIKTPWKEAEERMARDHERGLRFEIEVVVDMSQIKEEYRAGRLVYNRLNFENKYSLSTN